LERAGLRTTPANKDVKLSYNKVQDRFAVAGDGKPRLFFLRDSVVTPDPLRVEDHRPWNIEQELESHQWIPTKDGKSDKEDWVKEDDDAIDTMRYAVMYVDGGARFERPVVPSVSGRMSRPTQRGGVALI
jgi:phage terminase large subunit